MDLQFLHERWPALTFTDYETFMNENNQMFYQRWSLFVGVIIILVVATCLGVIQTLLHTIHGKRSDYAIQRLIGLLPNGLIKLILTQLLAYIDAGAVLVFDFRTLLFVSSFFLLSTCLIFSIPGLLD